MEKKYVVGIDIGGTNTVFGVVDARGTMVARSYALTKEEIPLFAKYEIKTQKFEKFNDFVDMIETKLNLLLEDNGLVGQIKGIGIGAPNAQYSSGSIVNPPNLIWDKGESEEKRTFKIVEILSEKMGCPAALDNDVNLAALGEKMYGNAKSIKDFIMIALGTGVGSGIFSNDALVRGNNGFAGELGHTVSVRHNGRLCGCGGRGHLEAYASATGVARTAREFLEA